MVIILTFLDGAELHHIELALWTTDNMFVVCISTVCP